MSLSRFNNKRDANEGPIVSALRKIGATVILLDQPFDLLVGYRGDTHIAEVKNPERPTNRNNPNGLTPAQGKTLETWNGNPVPILETPEQAVAWLREVSA